MCSSFDDSAYRLGFILDKIHASAFQSVSDFVWMFERKICSPLALASAQAAAKERCSGEPASVAANLIQLFAVSCEIPTAAQACSKK